MCSFRVKQFQEADYVYYVICVYRRLLMPSDIKQDSIINDFALGMFDVYILLMRHHYAHVTLYLSVSAVILSLLEQTACFDQI